MVRSIFLFFSFFFLLGKGVANQLPQLFIDSLNSSAYEMTPYILIVSHKKQEATLFKEKKAIDHYKISTAKNGLGERAGSKKTPRGLHRIAQKFGGSEPAYRVFVARRATGEIWSREINHQKRDFILSRVLWLEGLEEGVNKAQDYKGVEVDSFKRLIYIHGTNEEELIGKPASHGCIRMKNHEVIALFEKIPVGSLVWISSE